MAINALGLPDPQPAARPFVPSGNDVWDEIQQAHGSLSPAAQRAVALSGVPQQAALAESEPAPEMRPLAAPSNVRGLGSPSEPSPSTGGMGGIAPSPIAPAPKAPSPNQRELARLTQPPMEGALAHTKADTGQSGIGQIHNPVARHGLEVLDAIGSTFLPRLTMMLPGTQLHHRMLVKGSEGLVNQESEQSKNEAQANEANARAQSLMNPMDKPDTPFKLWRSQNPNAPAETWLSTEEGAKYRPPNEYADFKAGYAKSHPESTPDEIVEAFATRSQRSDIHAMYADAVNAAIESGTDPSEDPKVKHLAAAMQETLRQPAQKELPKDDRAIAIMAKPQGERTPDETKYLNAYDQWVRLTKVNPGVERAMIFVNGKLYPALDTAAGNAPTFINPNQAQRDPERYLPAGPGTAALNKTALLEDIRGNVQQVRQSLNSMPDFGTMDKAKIAFALRSRDPKGAINALVSGGALGSMSAAQQDYIINVTNLIENAMAMRSVLGAGQGSEDLRSAITATIPGPTTPDKAYAMKQLDTFEKVLDRLKLGVPKVELRDMGGQVGGQPIVQHSPSTGQYRYSMDGGKTWQPGQPPK